MIFFCFFLIVLSFHLTSYVLTPQINLIIIDNLVDNFKLQPNNGLGIKTWLEEMKDNQLNDLGNLLKEIVNRKPSDVRTVLKKIKEEANRRIKKNLPNPYKNLPIDKYFG